LAAWILLGIVLYWRLRRRNPDAVARLGSLGYQADAGGVDSAKT